MMKRKIRKSGLKAACRNLNININMSDKNIKKEEIQTDLISVALDQSKLCPVSPNAFSVGCVITHCNQIISKGYSRELEGNTHAEANAINKMDDKSILPSCDLYTTLEPCSVRTSGLQPCCDVIINNNIKTVYIGVNEPPDFVKCEGVDKLKQADIKVIFLNGDVYHQRTGRSLAQDCLDAARRST